MKKILLPVLSSIILIASCKKDDAPKQDIIQLQKIETEEEAYTFQYNEQNMLTRMEILRPEEQSPTKVLYRYATISYVDGKPATAEVFRKYENGFVRRNEITYKLDPQNRIAYIAIKNFTSAGIPNEDNPTDTIDFSFDANNLVTKVTYRGDGFDEFSYNAQGNLIPKDYTDVDGTNTYAGTHECRFDNGNNPFRVNGLGLLIYSLYQDNYFDDSQLLSANNPTYVKSFYKNTYRDEGGNVLDVYEDTYIREITNTYDENGGLKTVKTNEDYEYKVNGAVTGTGSYPEVNATITCVKKQQ